MQYLATILSGVAGSALFFLFDQAIPAPFRTPGIIAVFLICAIVGYWIAARFRSAKAQPPATAGQRIASGIVAGGNADVEVKGAPISDSQQMTVASDIKARKDVKIKIGP